MTPYIDNPLSSLLKEGHRIKKLIRTRVRYARYSMRRLSAKSLINGIRNSQAAAFVK